jgi:type IX secretion system PorP/SprF family membrane protein
MTQIIHFGCVAALFFSIFAPTSLLAQDKHFTQFYAAPLTLNPALTGAFEGTYRVGTIYRDQWRSVLDEPIKTFGVAGDFRFKPFKRAIKQDAFGLGLQFTNDRVSVLDFNTTQIAVSLAYHKALDADNKQFLSAGIQLGVTQRTVNYASLNFQDEFDGFSGYNLGTGETFPENNFSFSDINVGLNYTNKFGKNSTFFGGLAMHHITQPNISFFNNTDAGDLLFAKYSAQIAVNVPVGGRQSRTSFMPRFLVASQGNHLEINTGANFRMALGEYRTTAVHLGTWLRPVRNNNGMGIDAAVALVGLEYNNVLFGMSYDLNLRALTANQRQGAFEISIAYLGDYESGGIVCPKF